MYGSYCMVNYPGIYGFHDLKALRHAGIIRGRRINKSLLRMLAYDIDFATFEKYDCPYSLERFNIKMRRALEVFSGVKIREWPGLVWKIIHNDQVWRPFF
jgi:hypothetical protein